MKHKSPRIVEIRVCRSKKRPRLGHAIAVLFPCSHKKYLGITLYKGEDKRISSYLTAGCNIIKFESYDVMDKEHCKVCPDDTFFLDDLQSEVSTLEDELTAIDNDD